MVDFCCFWVFSLLVAILSKFFFQGFVCHSMPLNHMHYKMLLECTYRSMVSSYKRNGQTTQSTHIFFYITMNTVFFWLARYVFLRKNSAPFSVQQESIFCCFDYIYCDCFYSLGIQMTLPPNVQTLSSTRKRDMAFIDVPNRSVPVSRICTFF